MEINKLIITPITKGMAAYRCKNPSNKIASQLITERLLSGSDNKIPRALRKLPKSLRGWVNSECKVVPDRRTNFYV